MEKISHILLVEDEEHIAKLIEFKLRRDGHEVRLAKNGQEALEQWNSGSNWDLVILDVMMPILDGWQVLKRLRQENARIPVLMLTAKSSEIDISKSAELGATQFVRKPFDPAELARVVREMLNGAAR